MNKNILIIVEGEKADFKLMENITDIFLSLQYKIWTYKTNIYDLYTRLTNGYEDELGDLELLDVLREKETDEEIKRILSQRYTDILLIFDFDPHDPRYTKEKIMELKKYFCESTDRGKLYINYPMVEAFKHIISFDDINYKDRIVTMEELQQGSYKSRVAKETTEANWMAYDRVKIQNIINLNLKKVNYILNKKFELPKSKEEYFEYDFDEILNKQIELLETQKHFYVLNTCIFYILDYMPKLLEELR